MSEAVAVNVTVPDTGAPVVGAARFTVGFVVSRVLSNLVAVAWDQGSELAVIKPVSVVPTVRASDWVAELDVPIVTDTRPLPP